MRNLIVFIHAGHPIETEAAKLARWDFAQYGYELEEFSVVAPGAEDQLKAILRDRGDEVFFFLSLNFWALNIRHDDELLHTFTGIPLVILMCDHPVYFLHFLSSALDGTLILAPGEELPDFIEKHYGIAAKAIGDPGIRPYLKNASPAPDFADFSSRKNIVFCPINLTVHGQNIDETWATIKALPPLRRARAERLIDASLTDCLTPLHIISENMGTAGDLEIAVEDLRWVLNFVKLWRRTRLVESLIDLPVLVSSNYVPAELERRHPTKFTLFSRPETAPLYNAYRFVVNSNPLIHCFHDRFMATVAANAVCITDTNLAIARYFDGKNDMVLFDYTTGDLAERVAGLLDDPQRAYTLTVENYRVRTSDAFASDAHRKLLDAVSDTWAKRIPPTG